MERKLGKEASGSLEYLEISFRGAYEDGGKTRGFRKGNWGTNGKCGRGLCPSKKGLINSRNSATEDQRDDRRLN